MTALNEIGFDPTAGRAALKELPTVPAVFALYSAEAKDEPYVGRTPNLRVRLERLLVPSDKHPRRLQLASRVRRIAWQPTGSEFESLLAQFALLEEVFGGDRAVERMHLRAASFVRFVGANRYPRVAITTRPSAREAGWAYGPFASRAAAERYVDEALKLFSLRRCTEDLEPHPDHPGCVYSEMKMCLAPCFAGCTDERYAEEAAAVERFLATRGESRLAELCAARDRASAELEFERAALIHSQVARVEGIRALAPELVRPVSQQRAIVLQVAAEPGSVAVFLFENGRLRGPGLYSTFGMRIQNEQSGSTSLFAHPMALEPVVEEPVVSDQGSGIRAQNDGSSQVAAQGTKGPEDAGVVDSANEYCLGAPSFSAPFAQKGGNEAPPFNYRTDEGRGESAASEQENHAQQAGSESAAETIGENTEARMVGGPTPAQRKQLRGMLESRWEELLAGLEVWGSAPTAATRQGHMALLKRWYYRPEVKRVGEVFFPEEDGQWPVKSILRGIGRVAAKAMEAEHG
jgi:hypothetical protein